MTINNFFRIDRIVLLIVAVAAIGATPFLFGESDPRSQNRDASRAAWDTMTDEERSVTRDKLAQFRALSEEQRQSYRELHRELAADPELLQTARTYSAWLPQQNVTDAAGIRKIDDSLERAARVAELADESTFPVWLREHTFRVSFAELARMKAVLRDHLETVTEDHSMWSVGRFTRGGFRGPGIPPGGGGRGPRDRGFGGERGRSRDSSAGIRGESMRPNSPFGGITAIFAVLFSPLLDVVEPLEQELDPATREYLKDAETGEPLEQRDRLAILLSIIRNGMNAEFERQVTDENLALAWDKLDEAQRNDIMQLEPNAARRQLARMHLTDGNDRLYRLWESLERVMRGRRTPGGGGGGGGRRGGGRPS